MEPWPCLLNGPSDGVFSPLVPQSRIFKLGGPLSVLGQGRGRGTRDLFDAKDDEKYIGITS
jgi:hypothetical protein